MSKLMTVHESEWNKLEAEIIRLENQHTEFLKEFYKTNAENARLGKLVDDISYTAKNRKNKMHLYRDALIEIGHWTQETQDSAQELNSEGAMWRGCVAQANMVLEEGGDAVEGRDRVYPDGYLDRKGKDNE